MHRILLHVDHASAAKSPRLPDDWNGWSVHFVDCETNARIGPWLLLDRVEELDGILRWGNATDLDAHQHAMRAWCRNSVSLYLSDRQRDLLIQRGRVWPWNGYMLLRLMENGAYPPAPLRHPLRPLAPATSAQPRAAS